MEESFIESSVVEAGEQARLALVTGRTVPEVLSWFANRRRQHKRCLRGRRLQDYFVGPPKGGVRKRRRGMTLLNTRHSLKDDHEAGPQIGFPGGPIAPLGLYQGVLGGNQLLPDLALEPGTSRTPLEFPPSEHNGVRINPWFKGWPVTAQPPRDEARLRELFRPPIPEFGPEVPAEFVARSTERHRGLFEATEAPAASRTTRKFSNLVFVKCLKRPRSFLHATIKYDFS